MSLRNELVTEALLKEVDQEITEKAASLVPRTRRGDPASWVNSLPGMQL